MKLVILTALMLVIGALAYEGLAVALWGMNQPSDLAVLGSVVGLFLWGSAMVALARFIWRHACEEFH